LSSTGSTDDEGAVGHPDWHQYHPFPHTLKPIDRRGPAKLVQTPSSEKDKRSSRTVRFAEDEQKSLADHLAKQISPIHSEFIKTPSNAKATSRGQRMTLDASGARHSIAETTGMAKKSKDSGKDGAKDEDGKKKDGLIDTTELDNRMRALKGMSQLHRAAVADRFRFCASASSGEPMVLKASSLNQANPGKWASDSAFLNKFHNSAIRIVAPSGLEVLKETDCKKKKKKKKDSDGELQMSDSGLFVARYPIDENLVKIRKIRKKAFPDEDPHPVPADPTEEHRKTAAAELKQAFSLGGGGLLSRIRDNEDDHKEQEAALAASGYADPI
jgi:hypothetical protein